MQRTSDETRVRLVHAAGAWGSVRGLLSEEERGQLREESQWKAARFWIGIALCQPSLITVCKACLQKFLGEGCRLHTLLICLIGYVLRHYWNYCTVNYIHFKGTAWQILTSSCSCKTSTKLGNFLSLLPNISGLLCVHSSMTSALTETSIISVAAS